MHAYTKGKALSQRHLNGDVFHDAVDPRHAGAGHGVLRRNQTRPGIYEIGYRAAIPTNKSVHKQVSSSISRMSLIERSFDQAAPQENLTYP